MPNSTSLLAYPEVKEALETALNSERGIKLTFKDAKSAFHFTGRANSFRMLDRKENLKVYPEPAQTLHGRSVYDVLVIKQSENEVTIVPRKLEAGITEIL